MAPANPKSGGPASSARDVFKLLTRGSNRKPAPASTAVLPSAGAKANPQLYHDEVRGHKRKRPSQDAEAPVAEELPVVDFFAPKQDEAKVDKKKPKRQPSPERKPVQLLSSDECRHVLKSHRIKVTLMYKPAEPQTVKKSKKKKSKVEDEFEELVAQSKKDEKKQLNPQPLESFSQLRSQYGLSRGVAENLVHQGFREPTEVQLGSLPTLLDPTVALQEESGLQDGVDFMAVAPTGSGKTISFLIAAINNITRRREKGGKHGLEAVIVAPTRELVHQIVNEGNKLVQGTGLKVAGMRRGTKPVIEEVDPPEDDPEDEDEGEAADSESDEDDAAPKQKKTTYADILVTTPGLLIKFLSKQKKTLSTVKDLILDEADVLLDPLFRDQTLSLWTSCTNPSLRLSFWSATMGSNIETLVTSTIQTRAKSLETTPKPLVRLVVGLKDTAVPNVTHKLLFTGNEAGKLLAIRSLIRPTAKDDIKIRLPFLVFTETIERATALHDELRYDIPVSAGGSGRIAALHSGLNDAARSAIVRKFRAGEIWLLITTDLLARGLDFRGVNGVVNYDVPTSAASYIHRSGRTGRAGREGGIAVTMWTHDDIPILKTVANVIVASERQAGMHKEEESAVPKWLLERLPDVSKEERKKLKKSGKRKTDHKITSTSGVERQKENNRKGAIEASKKRKKESKGEAVNEEWGGFDD
ncbi:P-loop containing nucleoside triphosphate hydrolase protein [Emericellopsis atlantica]|uniref:ATP-dependent RNA helicase ROK1 n=1 Tax=Emericellopsis atlantica TaxID=2614577 RepID=A0A9P8CQT9_9HYPO|nr:P-loop containing nucleoside triphosphate hydrolase protein [Emericellopsis atlantica]KAG9256003.1 P-loop containing nucleoside triphosphate hydrolase protein [Emericellopsis atlantica]